MILRATLLFCLLATNAYAKQAPPRPPDENPHPPTTAEERSRVAFAEQAVKIFLQAHVDTKGSATTGSYRSKDDACLKSAACYANDAHFLGDLSTFYAQFGQLTAIKHFHVVPQAAAAHKHGAKADEPPPWDHGMIPLEPGEFAVHLYGADQNGRWLDVSVILVEENGRLSLRRFLAAHMENPHKLPPGAKC